MGCIFEIVVRYIDRKRDRTCDIQGILLKKRGNTFFQVKKHVKLTNSIEKKHVTKSQTQSLNKIKKNLRNTPCWPPENNIVVSCGRQFLLQAKQLRTLKRVETEKTFLPAARTKNVIILGSRLIEYTGGTMLLIFC